MMSRVRRAQTLNGLIVAAAAVGVAACGSGGMALPANAAGTELFEQAEQYLAAESWSKAIEAYDTLLRNYPTSPHLPDARLGIGRAYYERGRTDALLLSIDAFKNFLTYHPSHVQTDYAQLMVAMGYAGLMRSPDRDQGYTKEALEEYDAFLEDYPDSGHRQMALDQRIVVVNTLAGHELAVAKFQMGRDRYVAAQARCDYALRKYPTTVHRCEILYTLAEALRQQGIGDQAAVYYQQIVSEYPGCSFVPSAQTRLRDVGIAGEGR